MNSINFTASLLLCLLGGVWKDGQRSFQTWRYISVSTCLLPVNDLGRGGGWTQGIVCFCGGLGSYWFDTGDECCRILTATRVFEALTAIEAIKGMSYVK